MGDRAFNFPQQKSAVYARNGSIKIRTEGFKYIYISIYIYVYVCYISFFVQDLQNTHLCRSRPKAPHYIIKIKPISISVSIHPHLIRKNVSRTR